MENINKIWGERRRIHLDNKNEIDLLYLKTNTFCSTHIHDEKINKFLVIKGCVKIQTDIGNQILKANESWVVRPPLKHRFLALEDSIMIEMAYVEGTEDNPNPRINPNDIFRYSLGGKIIDGEECPIDILKMKGLLDL